MMKQCTKHWLREFSGGLILAIIATASISLNTNLSSTPRFDGAGYAVLAEALATGRGYREINKPDTPPHDHFPPGYPLTLAVLWQLTGRSALAAHVLSEVCMTIAVILAWRWFQAMYSWETAFTLSLALAINWTWSRVGGSIQSEPIYIFWELATVLIASSIKGSGNFIAAFPLGLSLAACALTRHIGGCLVIAVSLVLSFHRQWKMLLVTALVVLVPILPWLIWLLMIRHQSQFSLFTSNSLGIRVIRQSTFYLQRFPDQITGPFVEVVTGMWQSPILNCIANFWAILASATLIWGWIRVIHNPRRQLASLISLTTLALLLVWPFTEAGRFLIPLVPMLLIGFTEGLARLVTLIGLKQQRNWAARLLLAVSIPYAVYEIVEGRAEAQLRRHANFDAACIWIAQHASEPGPVLTQHPGEVYWQTGHSTIEPKSPTPDEINRLIDKAGVRYLLVDDERYMSTKTNPLQMYVRRYSDRVALIWSESYKGIPVQIFKIVRPN